MRPQDTPPNSGPARWHDGVRVLLPEMIDFLKDPRTEYLPRTLMLEKLRLGWTIRETIEYHTRYPQNGRQELEEMLTADVLSERLPPETVTHTERQHISLDVPRWSTWWDHAKATYAGRWWAGWYVRRRPPHTVTVPVAGWVTATATVNLERFWTYPEASIRDPNMGTPLRRSNWY